MEHRDAHLFPPARLDPTAGSEYPEGKVRVFNYSTLRHFFEKHADAKDPLLAWHEEATRANWQKPLDIKSRFHSADFVGGNRVIFDIKGNKYRLVVAVRYEFHAVYIRFIGTHAEYIKVNAVTV